MQPPRWLTPAWGQLVSVKPRESLPVTFRYQPSERMPQFQQEVAYETLGVRKPLLVMRWPEDAAARPPLRAGSALQGVKIYAPDYDKLGKRRWLPAELSPLETY